MDYIITELTVFTPLSAAFRIVLAAVLGGVIGFERSRNGHDAGLRTHIFICLGSAMTALVGLYAATYIDADFDPLRISAQVVSGIGFLGAGTILVKNSSKVTGLTTAAGMWATATIGLATGFGFYNGALLCTVVCVITAGVLSMLERNRKGKLQLYIEVEGAEKTNSVISTVRESFEDLECFTVPAKSAKSGNIGIMASLSDPSRERSDIIGEILKVDGVILTVPE